MDDDQQSTQWKSFRQFQGIFFSTTSGISIALTGVVVKFLKGYTAFDLVFFRSLTTAILALPLLICCRDSRYRELPFKMIPLCSIFWCCSLIFRFMSYYYLPLGEAQVIALGSVIFTTVLERIFLKTTISRLTLIGIIVSTIGLCLIAKLPDILLRWSQVEDYRRGLIGMAYGITSCICNTFGLLVIRAYFSKANESLVTFTLNSMNVIVLLTASLALGPLSVVKDCGLMSWLLIVVGILGYAVGASTNKALQTVNASTFSVVRLGSDVLVAVVSQLLIFGEPITLYSGLGCLFVVIGAFIPAFQKWILLKPIDHKFRRKLNAFLK